MMPEFKQYLRDNKVNDHNLMISLRNYHSFLETKLLNPNTDCLVTRDEGLQI